MPATKVYRTELTPLAFLRRNAYVFADKIAVVHGEQRFTYAVFAERVNRKQAKPTHKAHKKPTLQRTGLNCTDGAQLLFVGQQLLHLLLKVMACVHVH